MRETASPISAAFSSLLSGDLPTCGKRDTSSMNETDRSRRSGDRPGATLPAMYSRAVLAVLPPSRSAW